MNSEEKIKELLVLTNFENTFIAIRDGMLVNLKQEIEDLEMFERAMSFIIKEFKKEDFIQMSIEIYQDYYSAEEIEHLHHFYQTEVGQKISQKQPLVSRAIMDHTQSYTNKLLEKLPDYLEDKIS